MDWQYIAVMSKTDKVYVIYLEILLEKDILED